MLAHPAKLWLINTDLDAANGYGTKMSPRNHSVPLAESQHHVINPTNPRGALDDGVEHRLHVRRRAADDAEHLGRRRLMLQRLAQFRVALLKFLEQSDVLDGDNRLVGEGFKQFDLLVGERPDLRSADDDRPDSEYLRAVAERPAPVRIPRLFKLRQTPHSPLRAPPTCHGCEPAAGRAWLGRSTNQSIGRVSPTGCTGRSTP